MSRLLARLLILILAVPAAGNAFHSKHLVLFGCYEGLDQNGRSTADGLSRDLQNAVIRSIVTALTFESTSTQRASSQATAG